MNLRRMFVFIGLISAGFAAAQELPRPTPLNSIVVSLELDPSDAKEAEYIKSRIPFGLYAWPSFSVTTLTPSIPWQTRLDQADANLGNFKADVDRLVAAAKAQGFKLHLVLTSGLARTRAVYKEAKLEDVRNCQWYNDNNIATAEQLAKPEAVETDVFATLSRYARKLHYHLEAKARAAMKFLAGVMAAEPDTLIAVSGWGEAELNFGRIVNSESIQPFFCDYSPFAVLEFRDWIQHAGEYGDERGAYRKEGWPLGGKGYQGKDGLTRFNSEFKTSFSSWDLRYYNWNLQDDYDPDYSDTINKDPKRIPFEAYATDKMKFDSGAAFIEGGFDPPRVMKPGDPFWDLWNLFRETMVSHFVRDAARWASESGIPADRWFSHQLPGDYLFGKSPADPPKNGRYYASASPLWTADIAPYGQPGVTIYDSRFKEGFVRTTQNILPAAEAMSKTWAVMEYDPEGYPPGNAGEPSRVEKIVEQYMRVYNHNVYLINFWRWQDETGEHQIKGTNKEKALVRFVAQVRDKAKSVGPEKAFTPPPVWRISAKGRPVEITIAKKIWASDEWDWKMWGGFDRFEIFRSESPGVPIDPAHLAGKTENYIFLDKTAAADKTYYYRVRAINDKNASGPPSPEITVRPGKGAK